MSARFCSRCGAPSGSPDARFCKGCGNPFTQREPVAEEAAPKPAAFVPEAPAREPSASAGRNPSIPTRALVSAGGAALGMSWHVLTGTQSPAQAAKALAARYASSATRGAVSFAASRLGAPALGMLVMTVPNFVAAWSTGDSAAISTAATQVVIALIAAATGCASKSARDTAAKLTAVFSIVLAAVQGASMMEVTSGALASANLFIEFPVCFTQGLAFLSTAQTTWVSLARGRGQGGGIG